jgi:RNA polymerase sigma-70 factor, ECF subfamily
MAGRRKVEEAGGAGIGVDELGLNELGLHEHRLHEHRPLDAAVLVSVSIADLAGVIHLSDTDLLRLHVAGDPDAFGMLFLRHRDRLWAVALRTVTDPEDAADALQEAMVSAFRRAGDFRGDSAVTTWLHRIVVNAAVDRLRRRPAQSLSWSGEPADLDALAVHAASDSGARSPAVAVSIDPMDSTEVRLDVDSALRRLPEQQRIALVLVDMLGYPVAEAAEMLGVSAGTIKSRCARGRVRLLPFLSHLRTNFEDDGNQQPVTGVSLRQGRRRMSRRLGHPDPEALACFRAGMVGERRGRRLSAHVSRCPRCAVMCARLDAVLAALATASVPVLPSAAERRVISAIDAESGARASGALVSGARASGARAPTTRLSGIGVDFTRAGRPAAAIVRRTRAADSHARRWARSWVARAGVTVSLVAVIGSLGYLVRGTGTGSSARAVSSSSTGTAPGSLPVSRLSGTYPSATRTGGDGMPQGETGQAGGLPRATGFVVTDTGTKYRRSTLRVQVRHRLANRVPPAVQPIQPVITPATPASGPPPGGLPSPKARPGAGGHHQPANPPAANEVAPPPSLIGCVLHLTGNVPPEFVDRATYQARPAYVFADAVEAWVVGIDCTAARPALITAVRLGNAS